MMTIALSRLVHQTPAFLKRLSERMSALLTGLEEARTMAHRFKMLSQMTDGQLAARGLTRAQIPQAVLDDKIRA
jgi:hypothetical protein